MRGDCEGVYRRDVGEALTQGMMLHRRLVTLNMHYVQKNFVFFVLEIRDSCHFHFYFDF